MIETKIFDHLNKPSKLEKKVIIDFLYVNLEKYGDLKRGIKKAIEYSLKETTSFGGFTMLITDANNIVGVSVTYFLEKVNFYSSEFTSVFMNIVFILISHASLYFLKRRVGFSCSNNFNIILIRIEWF